MTDNETLPLICPECGQSDRGIRKKSTGFIEDIVKRSANGDIQGSGDLYISINGDSLYQCPKCGYNTGNIKYFMPEKLEEAKEETKQWWLEHPNGCC